jgi:hypothetical protein
MSADATHIHFVNRYARVVLQTCGLVVVTRWNDYIVFTAMVDNGYFELIDRQLYTITVVSIHVDCVPFMCVEYIRVCVLECGVATRIPVIVGTRNNCLYLSTICARRSTIAIKSLPPLPWPA